MKVTLPDLPEELQEGLQQAARERGQTLDEFVLEVLQVAAFGRSKDPALLEARIRARREKMSVWVTGEDLRQAIDAGRS